MKKFISNRIVCYTLGFLFFLLFWEILSLVIGEQTLVFPGPIETIQESVRILSKKYIYQQIGSSFVRMLIGYGVAFLLAFIFGILAGNFPSFQKMMVPFISTLRSIPTASLVFLFLVIAGARNAPILMVTLIAFPILYSSFVGGIENISPEINDALKIDGSRWWKKVWHVQIPLSLPQVFIGLSSSFGLSFKIEIMAEILTGDTKSGLGSAIFAAQQNNPTNMVPIFAYSLIAILFLMLITLLCRGGKYWAKKVEK